jgi:hypothetical protein
MTRGRVPESSWQTISAVHGLPELAARQRAGLQQRDSRLTEIQATVRIKELEKKLGKLEAQPVVSLDRRFR